MVDITDNTEENEMEVTIFTSAKHIGRSRVIDGVVVRNVDASNPDILFQRYTADYARYNSRPYKVGKRGYAKLHTAVAAVVASRKEQP